MAFRSIRQKVAHGQDEMSATLEVQNMMDEYNLRHPCPNQTQPSH